MASNQRMYPLMKMRRRPLFGGSFIGPRKGIRKYSTVKLTFVFDFGVADGK